MKPISSETFHKTSYNQNEEPKPDCQGGQTTLSGDVQRYVVEVWVVFLDGVRIAIFRVDLLHHVWSYTGQWMILDDSQTGSSHREAITNGRVL